MSKINAVYDLIFKIIPKLCSLYEDAIKIFDNFDSNKVINKEFMKKFFDEGEIDWNKLKFEKLELENKAIEYIYNFENIFPLCPYAMFYVDREKNIFKYFTLERTILFQKFPYLICGQKDEQHKNYRMECPYDMFTFETLVQTIISSNIAPIDGAIIK